MWEDAKRIILAKKLNSLAKKFFFSLVDPDARIQAQFFVLSPLSLQKNYTVALTFVIFLLLNYTLHYLSLHHNARKAEEEVCASKNYTL